MNFQPRENIIQRIHKKGLFSIQYKVSSSNNWNYNIGPLLPAPSRQVDHFTLRFFYLHATASYLRAKAINGDDGYSTNWR